VVVLSRQAERDLRHVDRGEASKRIRAALTALATGEHGQDVTSLAGAEPWRRLRVGDYRILYRPVEPDEVLDPDIRWLVARIVHRRDLQRSVSTLA
jgi:mRNA-degrading endonuclease RelE of RelBE toxin-antitoxin system